MAAKVLKNVPKVAYGPDGCTPYSICLYSCANYLGQNVDYAQAMAGSGAAFRLAWNMNEWDCGNVDIIFAYDDYEKPYRIGVESLGRDVRLVWRTKDAKKEDFFAEIVKQIDSGIPVIALGIIGPPEACVVTGYSDDGELYGWNCFQHDAENAATTRFDDDGYFITGHWWENKETKCLILMGKEAGESFSLGKIINNAVEALSGRVYGGYAKGIMAYDAWKKAISDDSQFAPGAVLPLLAERMVCQGDGMDCVADGRHAAAVFFEREAAKNPAYESHCLAIAGHFKDAHKSAIAMYHALGGFMRGEEQMRRLCDKSVRNEICGLIDRCKSADSRALERMISLGERLDG